MSAGCARAHAWVSGQVQGVFYRASTAEAAVREGLQGWVRNLADGRVELVAEGPRPAVEALLTWARSGPPAAHVDDLEVRWEPPRGDLGPFQVRV